MPPVTDQLRARLGVLFSLSQIASSSVMVSLGGIKLMYAATFAGAGSFGIVHLLHPQVFTKYFDPAIENTSTPMAS